jgi:hypothetical protein
MGGEKPSIKILLQSYETSVRVLSVVYTVGRWRQINLRYT